MTDAMTNSVDIELDGQNRTMRASFAAIRGIEKDLGKSIISVVNNLGLNADLSITDAATIIYHGLRGNADTRMSLEQVGEAILKEGFNSSSLKVVSFLSVALNGVQMGKPEAQVEAAQV